MYKEKVTPTENHGRLAFFTVIAGILVYIIGFGIIGEISRQFKWVLQLSVFALITYTVYFMYTRLMGDYYYIIDDGMLYCGAQTGNRARQIAALPISDLVCIEDGKKNFPDAGKVYNAVKSLSEKNVKTAVFVTDEKKYVLHFEPTDKLIEMLSDN